MRWEREVIFVLLFSAIFTVIALLAAFTQEPDQDWQAQLLAFPIFALGLSVLRLLTRFVEALARGGRWLGRRLSGRYKGEHSAPAAAAGLDSDDQPVDLVPTPESYPQMLVNLVFVGGLIAVGIALAPFMILFEAMSLFGELSEDSRWLNGFLLTAGSVLTLGWLIFLERFVQLTIKLPLLSVRAVWLLPFTFFCGLVWFVFPGAFA